VTIVVECAEAPELICNNFNLQGLLFHLLKNYLISLFLIENIPTSALNLAGSYLHPRSNAPEK